MAEISADVRLKTIVRHFLGDRDAYMTTRLPEINGCIPDIARVSDYGSSPPRGELPFNGLKLLHCRLLVLLRGLKLLARELIPWRVNATDPRCE